MSYSWGSSAPDGTLNGVTITSSSSALSTAISNNNKAVTECGLICTYASGSTLGAKVEILRTYDGGSNWQVDADAPQSFLVPFVTNATVRWVWSVPGTVSQFKVNVINLDSSHSITAVTLNIRQATN